MSGWDWNAIYLTCFGIGLVLSLLSFFGGTMHLRVGHLKLHGHLRSGATHTSPLNGFTMVAFLCWFGGAGYLLHRASVFGTVVVLGFSVLSGLAGAGLVFWFLASVLLPAERTLESADTEIVGVTGKLSGAIRRHGCGEMIYSQNGARRSAVVKADDGSDIEQGAEVIVMRFAKGVAYVRRWDEFEHGLMNDAPGLEEKQRQEP